VQGGYTAQRTAGTDGNDAFLSTTPELAYLTGSPRALMSLTYAFTGTLHSAQSDEVANRLALATVFEMAKRTQLLLGAEGLQSSLGNYLLRSPSDSTLSALPSARVQLLTLSTTQALSHDFTPLLRLTESILGSYLTSLDPDVSQNTYAATAMVGVDRSWKYDALGVELRGQFFRTLGTASRDAAIVSLALGPRWSHDVSRTVSTSLMAAGAAAFTSHSGDNVRLTPSGRASVLFHTESSGVDVSYTGGFEPNLLLGSMLESHRGTVRGYTPLVGEDNVIGSISLGYLHAKTVDLNPTSNLDGQFDTILADADLAFKIVDNIAMFARYQFVDQFAGEGAGAPPALLRHGVFVGLDLAPAGPSRARSNVPTSLPQRVDRSDAAPAPEGYEDFGKKP
jgi:hypothetical protein